MRFTRTARRIAGVSVAAVAITGLGVGVALATMPVNSNARAVGRGVNEFAMTGAYLDGHTTNFTLHPRFLVRHEREVGGVEWV